MTAPTLPETLTRLAQLMPERVRVENEDRILVRWGVEPDRPGDDFSGMPRWRYLWAKWSAGWVAFHDMPEQFLEAALREECEERAWWWQVQAYDGAQWLAQVSPVRDEPGGRVSTDSPALALLNALGGEGA